MRSLSGKTVGVCAATHRRRENLQRSAFAVQRAKVEACERCAAEALRTMTAAAATVYCFALVPSSARSGHANVSGCGCDYRFFMLFGTSSEKCTVRVRLSSTSKPNEPSADDLFPAVPRLSFRLVRSERLLAAVPHSSACVRPVLMRSSRAERGTERIVWATSLR